MSALPWASFFKSACPTAYSFPRDDRTSMFVCSNGETGVTRNTQSCEHCLSHLVLVFEDVFVFSPPW